MDSRKTHTLGPVRPVILQSTLVQALRGITESE